MTLSGMGKVRRAGAKKKNGDGAGFCALAGEIAKDVQLAFAGVWGEPGALESRAKKGSE